MFYVHFHGLNDTPAPSPLSVRMDQVPSKGDRVIINGEYCRVRLVSWEMTADHLNASIHPHVYLEPWVV